MALREEYAAIVSPTSDGGEKSSPRLPVVIEVLVLLIDQDSQTLYKGRRYENGTARGIRRDLSNIQHRQRWRWNESTTSSESGTSLLAT